MEHTCDSKSDTKSVELRKEGNELYKERKFIESMLKYNESLCYSINDSENLGIAYANRSAVCFEMKKYSECLFNIKLAMLHNYPTTNHHILMSREEKCLNLMRKNNNRNKWDFFKLSFKARKTNPQFADILELKFSEKFGRFIGAKEDIRAGSILAIEKPFCSVLLSNSRHVDVNTQNKYQRCSFCLKDNIFQLIPCNGCNCTMFCEECSHESLKSFHKYECDLMNDLIRSGSVHIALRIFFMALSAFDGSIDELEKFIMKIDGEDKKFSIFDFNTREEKNIKNYLRFLNSLTRGDKKFPIEEHLRILKKHPIIKEMLVRHENFIENFIQRQCQTNDHYFHGIFGANPQAENSYELKDLQEAIGCGWFPFHSLINHSCASNVMRIYVDGRVVLFAVRFIPKGSQLFDCYNVSFTKHPKALRQSRLLSEFSFKCECEACENEYKMPLPMKNLNVAKVAVKIEKDIANCIKKNTFKEICDLINQNHKEFPSLELIMLQKCFAHVLLILAK